MTTFMSVIRRPMSIRIRILATAVLGLLVGGCFDSRDAKFPLATGTPAFGEGGRFTLYSNQIEGDRYQNSEPIVMTRRGDGGYQIMNEKGETHTIYFHAVRGGRYVLQAWDERITRYTYVIVRITPTEALVYNPPCDEQDDKAQLVALGVEFYSTLECRIDRVNDPAVLFAIINLGEPTQKLVRQ